MISALDLRKHIRAAADELDLPLTTRQADQLAQRVIVRVARGTAPKRPLPKQLHAVLIGLASGEEIEESGRHLNLSTHTIKTHRRRLYRLLGAENGAHAVGIAMSLGLLRTAELEATGRSGGEGA
jgi:DNA-binding NarL/FixJ family response regulator